MIEVQKNTRSYGETMAFLTTLGMKIDDLMPKSLGEARRIIEKHDVREMALA